MNILSDRGILFPVRYGNEAFIFQMYIFEGYKSICEIYGLIQLLSINQLLVKFIRLKCNILSSLELFKTVRTVILTIGELVGGR